MDAGREVQEADELRAGTRRFWLRQGSATRLDLPDASVDFIVTDPPYYDSVQYSDLAAFFRVWLRQLLPEAADWDYDAADSAVDPHKNDRASRYTELLSAIFGECRRVLRENGRLIFTFHHWNPKAWAALTIALKQAGFVLLNYSVVHSEHPVSVHIHNMNALTHDAILVLGVEGKRGWERPLGVRTGASAEFVGDCAGMVGWMLANEMNAAAVREMWGRAF